MASAGLFMSAALNVPASLVRSAKFAGAAVKEAGHSPKAADLYRRLSGYALVEAWQSTKEAAAWIR